MYGKTQEGFKQEDMLLFKLQREYRIWVKDEVGKHKIVGVDSTHSQTRTSPPY